MAVTPNLANAVLQVAFHRQGDRYAHTISIRDGERAMPVLASREDNGDDLWPVSPPLQQLELDTDGEIQRALLLGMAGRSYWSVSIELGPENAAVCFDVACRVKEEPPATNPEAMRSCVLGSTYQTTANLFMQSDTAALLRVNATRLRIVPLPTSVSDAAVLMVSGDELWLGPIVEPERLPRTIRWRYRIGLA
jgi:hypothetical protein